MINDLRFRYAFDMLDEDHNGQLSVSELGHMVEACCCGPQFLRDMKAKILGEAKGSATLDQFQQVIIPEFNRHGLHSRDVIDGVARLQRRAGKKRVVLDPVIVTMRDGGEGKSAGMGAPEHQAARNRGLVLAAELLAPRSWRGGLAPARGSDERNTAQQVIANAATLVHGGAMEEALAMGVCSEAGGGEAAGLLQRLLGSADPSVQLRRFCRLAREAQRIVKAQPALVRVRAPAKVFGDVHGQFQDLIALFREFGMPTHHGGDIESVSYVFNGDFVDRGPAQVETLALLLALKVAYPARVWLVRGNHEFREQNQGECVESGRLPAAWQQQCDAHSTGSKLLCSDMGMIYTSSDNRFIVWGCPFALCVCVWLLGKR